MSARIRTTSIVLALALASACSAKRSQIAASGAAATEPGGGGAGAAGSGGDPAAASGSGSAGAGSSGGGAAAGGDASPATGGPTDPGDGSANGNGGEDGPTPVPFERYDVNHILSTGQSNSVALGGTTILDTTQPYGNLMFSSGVIPASACDSMGCKQYDAPTALVPLVEGDTFFYPVETMSAGLANSITNLAKTRYAMADHVALVTLHGRSGNTYWCLRKGGCNYQPGYLHAFDDAMQEVADGMRLAKAMGKTYVVRAVTAIHGESDHYGYAAGHGEVPLPGTDGTPDAIKTYEDGLLEWQRDYEKSVEAITGQTEPVPLLISQMHLWTDVPTSEVTEWQYEAHVASKGKVVLVTPGYFFSYEKDCLHYSSDSQRWLGEYFAKAYARIVFEGLPFEPLRPRTVTVAGNVLTAKFIVPKPPLVLDTTRVSNPGDYGFEVVDGAGAKVAIASVELAGPDTVKITLAVPPAGKAHLRYAYTAPIPNCPGPMTGVRGNLRDSDDTPSLYGHELFNWAVTFDMAAQ